jgi:hypothetical protein
MEEQGFVCLPFRLVPCVHEDVEFSASKDQTACGIAESFHEIGIGQPPMIGEHDHREIGLTNALCEAINHIWLTVQVIGAGRRVVVQVDGVPLPVPPVSPVCSIRPQIQRLDP